MFSIGDKIVYPMHGAGIIINKEKEILGEKKRYYVVNTCWRHEGYDSHQ